MPRFTMRKHGLEATNLRFTVTLTREDWDRAKKLAKRQGITPHEWLTDAATDGVFRHLIRTGYEEEEE